MALLITAAALSLANLNNETFICYYKSLDDKLEVPLNNATTLLGTKYLDISKDTILYVFGYEGKVDGNATIAIMSAYLNNTEKNVCLLNWEAQAGIGPNGINYPAVVEISQVVGKRTGQALVALVKGGLILGKLLLIGFSLGCHLLGTTGRELQESGCIASAIIGLDCAGPGFDKPLPLSKPLSKTDAVFVACFHTDPGHLGIEAQNCQMDVFVNYGAYNNPNGTKQQPGCNSTGIEKIYDICSHSRSVFLWADSLQYPDTLECSKASDYDTWVQNNGAQIGVTYMGESVNRSATCTHFMSTNAQSPYGKGDDGLKP